MVAGKRLCQVFNVVVCLSGWLVDMPRCSLPMVKLFGWRVYKPVPLVIAVVL